MEEIMKESSKALMKDVAKTVAAPVLTAIGTWVLSSLTGTKDTVSGIWASDPKTVIVWTLGAFSLGLAVGWAARDVRGRIVDEGRRRRHEDEAREAITRAHNLIDLLSDKEARMLLSMLGGQLEQDIFDTAVVGLLSLGAISAITETSTYSSNGVMYMFQVKPEWRLYAKWEADLLRERAQAGLSSKGGKR